MKQPDKPIYVLYESFRPNYDSHLVHTFSSAHKQKSLKVIKLFPHIVRFNIPHDVHHMVIGEWGNFCFCQVMVCIQYTHHTIHTYTATNQLFFACVSLFSCHNHKTQLPPLNYMTIIWQVMLSFTHSFPGHPPVDPGTARSNSN